MKIIRLKNGEETMVDDMDYGWLNQFKWRVLNRTKKQHSPYVVRGKRINGKYILFYMHRVIMNPGSLCTDHIDGDGFNNQRENLRICTHTQNGMNQTIKGGTSQYKGVYYNKNAKKWQSGIRKDRKTFYLGYFHDEAEAAKAYDEAAKELFGQYAKLNFP